LPLGRACVAGPRAWLGHTPRRPPGHAWLDGWAAPTFFSLFLFFIYYLDYTSILGYLAYDLLVY
jgi:hypothetical protein